MLVDAGAGEVEEKGAEVIGGAYRNGGGDEVEVLVREARTGCAK